MSLKKDVIGADVQINSNEAQKSLVDLTQKTSELANENDRLRITQAKLKALGKEQTEEYKKITKTISDNSKQIRENNTQMDALRKTIGVTEMSTKQLSKRALELRRELSGMTQASDPARFNKLNQELIETERQMRKNKAAIGETKNSVSPLIETAKGLLPAFGWAAIGAGAVMAFNKIKNSTDILTTQWDVFIGGLNQATNEFWRTLATGDWSNFIGRMREAINVGREYQATLDDLEEKSRALQIIEADARAKELDLEIKLRNKTLSNEERRKAGEERIQLEKDLAEKRTKLAQESYNNELRVTMQESQLSKNQIEAVMRDFDSMNKEQAKKYLELQAQYKSTEIQAERFKTAQARTGISENPFARQMEEQRKQLEAFPDSIKLYAQSVAGQGRTTDEQLNKTVDAWVKLKEAQNSAVENIPRIITQVNTLLAGEDEFGQKLEDKALKAKKDAYAADLKLLDEKNNARVATLASGFEREAMTEDRFKAEQLSNELAYLTLKKALAEKHGQDVTDIDAAINQRRIEMQKSINDVLASGNKELYDQIAEDAKTVGASIDESIKVGNAAMDEIEKQKDREADILQQRQDAYMQFAMSIGEGFGQLMSDSEATFGDYLAKTLEMALEAFHQFFLIEKYKAIISGISGGFVGAAIAVAKVTAMELAYQGAKALIMRSLSSNSKQSGGFSNTDGPDYQPDGVYHKNEFIASAPAVRNPTVKPILNIIDMAQRSGTIASLNLPAVMASMGASANGRQNGGFASSSGVQSPVSVLPVTGLSSKDIETFSKAVDKFEKIKLEIDIVTVKKKLDKLEEAENYGLS